MHTTLRHLLRDKNVIALGVITLIMGIGIGYGIHGLTGSRATTAPDFAAGRPSGSGFSASRFAQNGARGNGLLTGTVAAKDANSITLNTRDGSSHVVLFTPDTSISKSVNGTLDDISTGSNVIISGTTNSNGSVSATLIQLRPASSMPAPQAQ